MKPHPLEILIFCGLFSAAALFMLFLGTMAWAYSVPAVALAAAAILIWTGWQPKLLLALLGLNQLTAIVVILVLFYRRTMQPVEIVTLDLSSLALIANMLLGGPALGLLSIPLLARRLRDKRLPNWLTSRLASLAA